MVTDPSKASSLDPNKIKEEGKCEMDAEDTRNDFVDERAAASRAEKVQGKDTEIYFRAQLKSLDSNYTYTSSFTHG